MWQYNMSNLRENIRGHERGQSAYDEENNIDPKRNHAEAGRKTQETGRSSWVARDHKGLDEAVTENISPERGIFFWLGGHWWNGIMNLRTFKIVIRAAGFKNTCGTLKHCQITEQELIFQSWRVAAAQRIGIFGWILWTKTRATKHGQHWVLGKGWVNLEHAAQEIERSSMALDNLHIGTYGT